MADQEKDNQDLKENKKKDKEARKAAKKEAKAARKKARLEKKDKSDKKSYFSLKKLVIFTVLIFFLIGSGFFVYKKYFAEKKEPVNYKSVSLKNVNLPDEMLEFSFYQINDLYYALVTYDLRVFLLTKEIERIDAIAANYPEQSKIADKEKKSWIRAKTNIQKIFSKIEKQIREIFVLYNVNKKEGLLKIDEKNKELLSTANEALKEVEPYIEKIESNKEKEPVGFINQIINKIKNFL